jgi:hypothetical protein
MEETITEKDVRVTIEILAGFQRLQISTLKIPR